MTTLQDSVYIAAPVEDVWSCLQDHDRRSEWDARVLQIRDSSGRPIRVGALAQYQFRGWGGLRFWMEARCVSVEPCRRSVVRFQGRSRFCIVAAAAGTWCCQRESTGTRFSTKFNYRLRLGWLGRLLDRFITQPTMKRETRRSLENLKRLLENDSQN